MTNDRKYNLECAAYEGSDFVATGIEEITAFWAVWKKRKDREVTKPGKPSARDSRGVRRLNGFDLMD